MRIDQDLNLVVPVRTDADGNTLIYGYHVPISRQVFEANYRILAATKSALASKGIHYQMDAGPRIASLVLMDEARRDAIENGQIDKDSSPIIDGAIALLADLKRLTTILLPTDTGWVQRPVDAAIGTDQIDADEWKEAESAIVFFTCHYSLAKRAQKTAMGKATASVLMGQGTSLGLSEFASSLPPLMKPDASGVKAA